MRFRTHAQPHGKLKHPDRVSVEPWTPCGAPRSGTPTIDCSDHIDMDYARSQKDGVEHRAVAVSYDKTKALNLICPALIFLVMKSYPSIAYVAHSGNLCAFKHHAFLTEMQFSILRSFIPSW